MADYFHENERVVQSVNFMDCEEEIQNDISRTLNWIYRASDVQMERLKNYLLALDKSERVDLGSERSKNVLNGVSEILDRISRGIEELDPRLKGTLVSTGSSNNQTKIGDCDEFDFIYELDINALLKGKATMKSLNGFHLVLDIDGEPDAEIVSCSWLPGEFVLNNEVVFDLFLYSLLQVLVDLELPEGWCHGGFNSPCFSWLHRQGPSFVLQFDYLNTYDNVPLSLSVDLVPMIRIRKQEDVEISMLNQFLMTETGMDHCWAALHDTFLFYGHSEELFLNKYPTESIPKTLIRICKALRTFLQTYSPKYPTKDYVKQVLDIRKQVMLGTKVENVLRMPIFYIDRKDTMIDIPGVEKYITYSDLGETIGNECMVKSYYIKQIVLLMMSVDESKGRGWTDDDLPDLVITVFRLIKNQIRRYCSAFPEIKIVELKVSVLIAKTLEATNPKRIMSRDNKERIDATNPKRTMSRDNEERTDATNPKRIMSCDNEERIVDMKCQRCPKIYEAARSSIKESIKEFKIPVRLIEGRLSAIFQLFQSVCKGQETAEIVYLKHYCDYRRDFEKQVTKSEYEEMLNVLKQVDTCSSSEQFP